MTPRLIAPLALAPLTALALGATPAHAVDAAQGKALFQATCAICHSVVPKKAIIGPPLFGVVGRKAGSVPGFAYSDAMKKAAFTWTPAKLAAYIDDPRKTVPGNRMPYFGIHDAGKAQAIAAYLATLK